MATHISLCLDKARGLPKKNLYAIVYANKSNSRSSVEKGPETSWNLKVPVVIDGSKVEVYVCQKKKLTDATIGYFALVPSPQDVSGSGKWVSLGKAPSHLPNLPLMSPKKSGGEVFVRFEANHSLPTFNLPLGSSSSEPSSMGSSSSPRGNPSASPRGVGYLKVVVYRAENLSTKKKQEVHPFCKVFVYDKHQATIVRNNSNPEWEETFYFSASSGVPPSIRFEVRNSPSFMKSDKLLAEAQITLSQSLAPNTKNFEQIELIEKSRVKDLENLKGPASLFIEYEYLPDLAVIPTDPTPTLGKGQGNTAKFINRLAHANISSVPKDQPPGTFTVFVTRAEDLVGVEKNGLSDPFVKIHVGENYLKTRVIGNTLTPIWDEELIFPSPTGCPSEFKVIVKDYNVFRKNIFLGQATVPVQNLPSNQRVPVVVELKTAAGDYAGRVHLDLEFLPEVASVLNKVGFTGKLLTKVGDASTQTSSQSTGARSATGTLKIRIYGAKELIGVEKNSLSDPFCRVHVFDMTRETHIVANTTEPVWDQTFDFPTSVLPSTIRFVVKDSNVVTKNVLLGERIIKVENLPPDQPKEGWVTLVRGEGEKAGSLLVEITWYPTLISNFSEKGALSKGFAKATGKTSLFAHNSGHELVRLNASLLIFLVSIVTKKMKQRQVEGASMITLGLSVGPLGSLSTWRIQNENFYEENDTGGTAIPKPEEEVAAENEEKQRNILRKTADWICDKLIDMLYYDLLEMKEKRIYGVAMLILELDLELPMPQSLLTFGFLGGDLLMAFLRVTIDANTMTPSIKQGKSLKELSFSAPEENKPGLLKIHIDKVSGTTILKDTKLPLLVTTDLKKLKVSTPPSSEPDFLKLDGDLLIPHNHKKPPKAIKLRLEVQSTTPASWTLWNQDPNLIGSGTLTTKGMTPKVPFPMDIEIVNHAKEPLKLHVQALWDPDQIPPGIDASKGIVERFFRFLTAMQIYMALLFRKDINDRGWHGEIMSIATVFLVKKNITIHTNDTESEAKAKAGGDVSMEDLEKLADFGSGRKIPIPKKWIESQIQAIGNMVEECAVQLRTMNTEGVISCQIGAPEVPAVGMFTPFALLIGVAVESNTVKPRPDPPFTDPVEDVKDKKEDTSAASGCVFLDIYGVKNLGNAKMREVQEIIFPYLKITPLESLSASLTSKLDFKTKRKSDTFNPVWNERIRIPAPNGKLPQAINIKLKTGRVLGRNETLGTINIPLAGLSATSPVPQQAFNITEGEGINPDTQIFIGLSYDPNARPWDLPRKSTMGRVGSQSVKKFTQGASQTRKNTIREITKWLVLATKLGTDGYKERKWIGGCVSSCAFGLIRLSVYSSGETIIQVPDEVLEAEKDNAFTRTLKKAILKIYDVLEIACLEVQRQKQEGSIGCGLTIQIPGVPFQVGMTIIFDIVSSYVISRGLAYLNAAGARVIFDGVI